MESRNLQLHRSNQNDRCRAHYCTLDRSACHRQRSYRLQPPCKPISGYDAFRWKYTSLRANRWRGPRRRHWQSQRATPRHSAEAAAYRYRWTTPSTSRSRPRPRRCARAIRTATGARSCSGKGWGNHPPWTRGRRRRRGATPLGAAGEVPRREAWRSTSRASTARTRSSPSRCRGRRPPRRTRQATQFKPPPPILRRRGLVGASGGPSCSYKYIMLSI